jgi:hypothetical protein
VLCVDQNQGLRQMRHAWSQYTNSANQRLLRRNLISQRRVGCTHQSFGLSLDVLGVDRIEKMTAKQNFTADRDGLRQHAKRYGTGGSLAQASMKPCPFQLNV